MPRTLDETYARMLQQIHMDYRANAVVLLKWLAYAERPLNLSEIRDTVLIDLEAMTVRFEDRGDIEDALNILSDLIVVMDEHVNDVDVSQQDGALGEDGYATKQSYAGSLDDLQSGLRTNPDQASRRHPRRRSMEKSSTTLIRLAHLSMKEYFESGRVAADAGDFHLVSKRAQLYLTQSCLLYIMYYSKTQQSDGTIVGSLERSMKFPLFEYASRFWYQHARQRQDADVSFEIRFLSCPSAIVSSGKIHNPIQENHYSPW